MLVEGMEITDELLVKFKSVVNDEFNPILYLSIDPGKDNGFCGYDARFNPLFMYTIPSTDMVRVLECFQLVKSCVMENYLLFPDKAKDQIYSDMETSRVIGRVESWAERNKVELIMQGSKIKDTAYKWAGITPPKKTNPNRHFLDAHVHFIYWGVNTKKISARDLLNRTTT